MFRRSHTHGCSRQLDPGFWNTRDTIVVLEAVEFLTADSGDGDVQGRGNFGKETGGH
jgi:hypothetical protein